MEVTKREILVSIMIGFIMIAIGIIIAGKINDLNVDLAEQYHKALQINDKETFDYALDTQQGTILVESTIKAADPVKYPEMTIDVMYVKKHKENYVMKTRIIPEEKDSDGNIISPERTETYWEWDYMGSQSLKSKQLLVFDNKYDTSKFSLITPKSIKASKIVTSTNGGWFDSGQYYYVSSYERYSYTIIPNEFQGSFLATTNKGLSPANGKTINIESKTMLKVLEEIDNAANNFNWIFWLLWIILTGIIVMAYIALDNKYLD